MDKVVVGLASIPSRQSSLEKVIHCLLNQTVKPDVINVYLNNFLEIPFFLRRENINVFQGEDLGDAGKFYKVGEVKGIYAPCDDDIQYAPNYLERLISGLKKYDYKRIVSFHGSIIKFPCNDYFRNRQLLNFKRELLVDTKTHIAGTGCAAFHTDKVKIYLGDFHSANMADIYLGVFAQKEKIGITVLRHRKKWLNPIIGTTENSLFQQFVHNAEKVKQVADLINSVEWKIY